MSSIYSLVKSKKVNSPYQSDWQERHELSVFCNWLAGIATSHGENCVPVDAQSAFDDVVSTPDQSGLRNCELFWDLLGDVTPPFRNMWLEGKILGEKVGIQVRREEVLRTPDGRPCRWEVQFYPWREHQGDAIGALYRASVFLSESGDPFAQKQMVFYESQNQAVLDDWEEALQVMVFSACHALSKMNCRNVELKAASEAKIRQNRPLKVLASIWHTIHLREDVLRVQSTGRSAFDTAPDTQHRAFWVRGHYTDYRNGPGHFGNPNRRYRLWIPEHERGNKELGETVTGYILA